MSDSPTQPPNHPTTQPPNHPTTQPPTILGLTGGIGSGKSTVARMLEALGARVFYADDEAKRLMIEDEGARDEIVARFGAGAYHDDGSLNRAHLAGIVFEDEDALADLNRIVHPRVHQRFQDARRRAETDGIPVLVKEAAILFESGGDRDVDAVIVVDAPEALRIRRVTERDGSTPDQVRARMANQWPASELRARADYVIVNDGGEEVLQNRVTEVWHQITDPTSSSSHPPLNSST